MSLSLNKFQRHFPSTSWTSDGASWSFRDTDQYADRVPLVMLPGAGGTGDVFYRAIDSLHGARRIISVSYPALDDADKLASGVLAALTLAGIKTFDLFGSSLGGYLAQSCVLKEPARIRRAMFGNAFYDGTWLQRKISREALQAVLPATHLANTLNQLRSVGEDTLEKADFKQTMLALVGTEQTADMAKASLLAVLGTTVLPRVPLLPEALALLDCNDDPVVDEPTRADMRTRYEGSKQYQLATGAHYPALLNSTEFSAALHEHFAIE